MLDDYSYPHLVIYILAYEQPITTQPLNAIFNTWLARFQIKIP
jgi:hypothetical protein